MELDAIVDGSAPLTKREREIYGLLAEGKTRRQIAEVLCRSLHTVDRHIEHILQKLDAENAHHAVSIGVAGGFLHVLRKVFCVVLIVGLTNTNVDAVRTRTRVRGREAEGMCASRLA